MTLTEADVVAAGNVALRLLDLPERAEFDHEYDQSVFVSTRLPDGETVVSSNGIFRHGSPVDAVTAVLDGITNDISETTTFYGIAFPRCPGHAHPAEYGATGNEFWTRCPQTGAEIRRVTV